jgi:hypothetical protein
LGPKVRFWTKFPSITSRWVHSAPEESISARAEAKWEKFAAKTEGAIMGFFIFLIIIPPNHLVQGFLFRRGLCKECKTRYNLNRVFCVPINVDYSSYE